MTGMYHYLKQAWRNPSRELMQERLIQWRAGDAFTVVDKPLRLDKARMLGYKAKKGIVVVRVRLKRGGRKRSRHTHGRKSRKQYVRKVLKMNYQWVAEIRASKRFLNLEVLNSYPVGKDGKYYFFEVIMVDPHKAEIQSDKELAWIINHKKRAERGLTSAARKSRGLRSRSPTLKVRPSLRAWNRQGK
ncbi:50S ribosomal protein L15e [Candidatus Pacearchaeota archaeon]|nr:50S ribosomal protein L15e [Candidatus Pacearchaeota archaeon]